MNNKQIQNWLTKSKNKLDRLYRKHVYTIPRPNFNEAEVIVTIVNEVSIHADGTETSETKDMALFPDYNGLVAQQNGWADNLWEYKFLAALIFARRYPNHPLSINVRGGLPHISDDAIDKIGSGELRLKVERGDGGMLTISVMNP